jgi:hypothetical protein
LNLILRLCRKQLTAIKYDDALDAAAKAARYTAWCAAGEGLTWLGFYETVAQVCKVAQPLPRLSPTHAPLDPLKDIFKSLNILLGKNELW